MMLDLESLSLYPLVRDRFRRGGSLVQGQGEGEMKTNELFFETFFCVVI